MPKTDAEWRALDEKLAREVMGWHKWDELPENAHRAYWQAIKEEPDEYSLAHNEQQWWSLDESGCPDGEKWLSDWQPHEDVAQALMALDALVDKHPDIRYWLAYKPLGRPDPSYWCTLWQPYCELYGHSHDGSGAIPAKAICLAIRQWMDAQKEAEDDPG